MKMVTPSLTTALWSWSTFTGAQIRASSRWSECWYSLVTPITTGINSTFTCLHSRFNMFLKSAYLTVSLWVVVTIPYFNYLCFFSSFDVYHNIWSVSSIINNKYEYAYGLLGVPIGQTKNCILHMRMSKHMRFEVSQMGKRRVAYITFIRFFACMNTHMGL